MLFHPLDFEYYLMIHVNSDVSKVISKLCIIKHSLVITVILNEGIKLFHVTGDKLMR